MLRVEQMAVLLLVIVADLPTIANSIQNSASGCLILGASTEQSEEIAAASWTSATCQNEALMLGGRSMAVRGEADAESVHLLQLAANLRRDTASANKSKSLAHAETALKETSMLLRSVTSLLQQALRTALRPHWQLDLANHSFHHSPLTVDIMPMDEVAPSHSLFTAADSNEWIVLSVCTVGLCLFDFFVIQSILPNSFWGHMSAVLFWILIAIGYAIFVWMYRNSWSGINWVTGYFLEWILSMDNLFVFSLIFDAYRTPKDQIHKAVFVGIIGAVLMRFVFFLTLGTLLHLFDWIRFLFGAFLIWSGIEAVREEEEDSDVTETRLVKGLKWLLGERLHEAYHKDGPNLFVWNEKGHLQVTVLFIVIWCLEVTDIIFAVDSVSAKISQIPQQYIAFSSSVLAMFGLRATFFIVHDLVQIFEYLKYGLCVILVFIGLELMLSHWLHLSSGTVCLVILSVFLTSIGASLVKKKDAAHEDANKLNNELHK